MRCRARLGLVAEIQVVKDSNVLVKFEVLRDGVDERVKKYLLANFSWKGLEAGGLFVGVEMWQFGGRSLLSKLVDDR